MGIPKEELVDVRNTNKLLGVLQIPVYENKKEKHYCYRFHDTLMAMVRFGLQKKYDLSR